MQLNIKAFISVLVLLVFIAVSCAKHTHTNEEIVQAMNNYDSLILKQDPAAIAQAFTPDGKLGDAAAGRDAIQKLLSQVTAFKIIEQSSTTNNIQIRGDSALQSGSFIQRNVDAKNDTSKVMGTYVCKWMWIEGEGWKIKHIATREF